ncbi:TetR/AcrR family transcriptional regulator [Flagellatimonas centrodinii]|uniref:TetR/AcrR family transcriptional regulator n=1 Tax=Flagellatimonas centrodinii TaxID=2806210 RepID=UPI001FF0182D|nr:TetR/AcrR family transcriptional regulator [Flagellatimonas centrodinii]ULQ46418.1 TetR/AcrR family transcriptional regulator [Flagellatimonas centrodinii]
MARQSFSERQVEQRRSEILEAAMSLFETGGLEAVSFRKIAAALGCSYSAPYRYFPSKDALLTAMRAQAFRWIERTMLDAIGADGSPRQRLRTLAEVFIRAGIERPQRYALMFFRLPEPEGGPRSLELAVAKRDALDVCTRTVAAAQRAGELRLAMDPLTASHLFWAGAHGLVSLQVAGQFVMGRDVDTLVPQMVRTLMQGLEAPLTDAERASQHRAVS